MQAAENPRNGFRVLFSFQYRPTGREFLLGRLHNNLPQGVKALPYGVITAEETYSIVGPALFTCGFLIPHLTPVFKREGEK